MQMLDINVYQAAQRRLQWIFHEFDNVYISFSGGKDSGVLLNLALNHIREHHPQKRLGVFHLDYEAQYSATTEYVDATYRTLCDAIEPLRCCVAVKCPTSTSMFETYWRPWEAQKRDIWVRELPENHLGKKDFPFLTKNTSDYDFQIQFADWYHEKKKAEKTCVLIGIRAEESFHRWRTITSKCNVNKYKNRPWTTQQARNIYAAYPIYDWKVEDVWAANARFGWSYNRLYDLFYAAGVSLHLMRVASPFHSSAKSSLCLYRVLDPDVWGKMVSRVNGVNFTALYGTTMKMGWKKIQKPRHFTWQEYTQFLLDSLPEEIAANYRRKLATSIKFWREKGGVLGEEAIRDLKAAGIPFEIGEKSNYKTDKQPIRMEYADEIDSKQFQQIPTWKRLCICILKNDHIGKYMGFSQTKSEMVKRKMHIAKSRGI